MTLPEKPIPTFEFPPDLLPKVRDFEKFYDLSELDWDQVTEIYGDCVESELPFLHYIVANESEYSVDETLRRLTDLGVYDFCGNILLKSNFISLWYYPGGADVLKFCQKRQRELTESEDFPVTIKFG